QSLVARHLAARHAFGLLDAGLRNTQQPHIDVEVAAVVDADLRMPRRVFVEYGGNVVLHMTGGEEHAGHGEDALDALGAQLVQAVADDRAREFEEAAGDRIVRQPPGKAVRHGGELADRLVIAAAMAAHHYADLAHLPALWLASIDYAQQYRPICTGRLSNDASYVQSHDTASGATDRRRGRRPGMALPRHSAPGGPRRPDRRVARPGAQQPRRQPGLATILGHRGHGISVRFRACDRVGDLCFAVLCPTRLADRGGADEHADRPERPLSSCRRRRLPAGGERIARGPRSGGAYRRPRPGDDG